MSQANELARPSKMADDLLTKKTHQLLVLGARYETIPILPLVQTHLHLHGGQGTRHTSISYHETNG